MERRSGAGRVLLVGLAMFLVHGRSLAAAVVTMAAAPGLRIAVVSLPHDGFPVGARTTEVSYLRGFTGRSLTIYDKSWAVACALCTELPTFENGQAQIVQRPDGSTGIDVTFDIDPDLTWDDGVPVTTADFLFGLKIAHLLGAGSGALSNISSATALDDHHFTLHEIGVWFDYNRLEYLFPLPTHLDKSIFDLAATPAEYRTKSLYFSDPTASGLSYGPYRVDQAAPDRIVLKRNPYWHGKQPEFDRIDLVRYTDMISVGADLSAGKIDMIAGETGFDLDGIYRLEAADSKSAYNFMYKPTLDYEHIDINLDNDMLSDLRVRQALLLGLDRPFCLSGDDSWNLGDAPRSFLPPISPNFDPTLPAALYNPEIAEGLLAAAGFTPGSDGIGIDARGRRLVFRFAAQLASSHIMQLVEAVKEQWRRIGVEIVLEDKQMADILPHRQFDLALYAWVNTPEFLLQPIYGQSGIPTAANNYRGLNYPGFHDAEMNDVVAELVTELDPAKRLLLWRRAQRIYADRIPALPIAFVPNVYVVPASMSGVEPTGHMIPTSYWVEDWRLR